MKPDVIRGRDFEPEMVFSASRSSGPGGQNVNKVSSRIELRFDVRSSKLLNEYEKDLIVRRLASKITRDGELIIVSQIHRSQHENKVRTIEKFYVLISKALAPAKKRIKTKPTAASKLRRLENKKLKSRKKELRKVSGY